MGVSPWARAPGSEQPGTKAGHLFSAVARSSLHQLRGQREERRLLGPQLHSALMVLLHPAQSWEMLSKTCSPSALGRLLFPRCERSLAAPAALATSSCQTAASRAASSPRPVSSPSTWVLLPARGPADTLGTGRQGTMAARPPPPTGPLPPPPRVGLGGGGEGSTLSALRNVLRENPEAIIPSYFPWPRPRYSAGLLHSQAPAPPLGRGRREELPSGGADRFYSSFAVVPFVSVNNLLYR